jgi:hypothetical protein
VIFFQLDNWTSRPHFALVYCHQSYKSSTKSDIDNQFEMQKTFLICAVLVMTAVMVRFWEHFYRITSEVSGWRSRLPRRSERRTTGRPRTTRRRRIRWSGGAGGGVGGGFKISGGFSAGADAGGKGGAGAGAN